MADLAAFSSELKGKSASERTAAIREAVDALPDDQKKVFAQALSVNLPQPDQATSNTVWLIIVWAFSLVMVGAVAVLGISVFSASPEGGTKPDMILTVFTTVTAFLAGLFAPSPVAKKADD